MSESNHIVLLYRVARRQWANSQITVSEHVDIASGRGRTGECVPVVVASGGEAEPAKLLPAPNGIDSSPSGRIEISLICGSELIVDREVDVAVLSRGLGVLERQ